MKFKLNVVKTRAILSSILGLLFLAVTLTGVGLFLSPSGRMANSTGWTFMSLTKFQLEKIHTLTGFILVALVLVHFILNYKMFVGETKLLYRRKKK